MRSPDAAQREIIGVLMVGLGVAFTAVAAFLSARVKRRLRESVSTKGRVVDTVERPSGEGRPTFQLVVAFTDEQGASRRFTSRSANSGWHGMVGQDIQIIYRREDPADARVHLWWVQWMMVTMVAGSAFVCLLAAAVVLLFPDL